MRVALLLMVAIAIVALGCQSTPEAGEGLDAASLPGEPAAAEVQTTESGLQYYVIAEGEGDLPVAEQQVTVHYTGYLTDTTKFDSSLDRNQPFTFVLGTGQVIAGWDEGVALMKPGAKYKLVIPPELGYGVSGMPPAIPGDATLVFDVERLPDM